MALCLRFLTARDLGGKLGLRVIGETSRHASGSIDINTAFDKKTGKAHFVRMEGDREVFRNWIEAYEYVARTIARDMALNAAEKRRRSSS